MFVQKFNFIVMKMHKNVATRAAPFGSYAPNRLSAGALPLTHWGGAYIAPPGPIAGLGVGPTGNGKEGGEGKRREGRGGTRREGRASWNAQIQSWQA